MVHLNLHTTHSTWPLVDSSMVVPINLIVEEVDRALWYTDTSSTVAWTGPMEQVLNVLLLTGEDQVTLLHRETSPPYVA